MTRKKATAEDKLRKVLATLDTAVQGWYEENAPDDKERYASIHIRSFSDGLHASEITLKPSSDKFLDIQSSKHTVY